MNPNTPGPWMVDEDDDVFAYEDGGKIQVAIVDGATTDAVMANARLIAGAPEMKARLVEDRRLFAAWQDHLVQHEDTTGAPEFVAKHIDEIDALIRRINGEGGGAA